MIFRRAALPLLLPVLAACAAEARGAPDTVPPPPAWSPPRPVGGLPMALAARGSMPADVRADAAGRLHALIATDADGDGDTDALSYARLDGGRWTAVEPLAEALGTADGARLAVDAAGAVHALWWERRGSAADRGAATHLVYRAREGAAWSAPRVLYREPDSRGVSSATVAAAVDCAGALRVVHSTAARGLAALARGRRGWSAAGHPGDAGALTAAWSARVGCPGAMELAYVRAPMRQGVHAVSDVFTRTLREDGEWTEARDVFYDPARYAHYPRLVTDARGARHALWLQDTDGSLVPEALFHARSEDGARWTGPEDVTPSALRGGKVWMVHAAPDARGGVHLLARFSGGEGAEAGIYALRLEDGRWSAPARLASIREMGGGEAFLAAEPGGRAVHALWKGADGAYRHALWHPSGPAR